MKWLSVVAVLLLVLAPVLGAPYSVVVGTGEAFTQHTPFNVTVQVFDDTGSLLTGVGTSCTATIYNAIGAPLSFSLVSSGDYYTGSVPSSVVNTTGTYPYEVSCAGIGVGGVNAGKFEVTATGLPWANGEDLTPVAVIVLLPFLLALITIVGSVTLDHEEHPALKIGLFLFSYLPFYVSLWWGAEAVGRWYNFPALTEAIGSGTFFGIIFFILLVFYVVLYFIIKAFQAVAEKNAKRLTY